MRYAVQPTMADRIFWDQVRAAGCVPCAINLTLSLIQTGMRVEFNHVTDTGRIIGHREGYGSCRYHHQGDFLPGNFTSYKAAKKKYGPSLGRSKKEFHRVYGSNPVLIQIRNALLEHQERH